MAVDRASLYPGPMGWMGDIRREQQLYTEFAEASPETYQQRPGKPYQEQWLSAFLDATIGRFYPRATGGYIHSFLSQYGGLAFDVQDIPAQIIGSCVASGGMRAFAYRMLAEVLIYGQFELLMGRDLSGPDSVISYAPFNYGWGRKIAGIRGGDGSLCAPHIESFRSKGVLDCNTVGLTGRLPEPADARLYRQWGDWQYIEQYESQAVVRLKESVRIHDVDALWENVVEQKKPCMICSSWGFAPHRYIPEFGIWEYRRSGTWQHNMTQGGGLDFSGDRFFKVDNSWPEDSHKPVPGQTQPGETGSNSFYVGNEEVSRWLSDRNTVCMTIGEIDAEDVPNEVYTYDVACSISSL